MVKRENHHINPKEIQRQTINYPHNKGVFDETTISLDHDFHTDITNQIRHHGKYRDLPTGVPIAYTLGEIQKKLTEEPWEDEETDE
jgi:hypothetical protein